MAASGPAGAATVIGEVVSHYRVDRRLGEGGMGVVYRAEDLRLGRRVALKFLREEAAADEAGLDRFRREARAASALNNPHICTVHDVGLHEGRPFIVMELLEGTTLADRLRRGPLPVAELLDLAVQLADALSAAHAKGIVHRDLKPGNVFLTDSGLLKVLDFGVAKLQREPTGQTTSVHGLRAALLDDEGGGSTEPGLILGTLSYMSPEQARGWEIDARSDLFSFGAVLYEMATGRRAFAGSSANEAIDAVLSHAPVAPSRLATGLPRALDAAILHALEKDRDARCPSATKMLETLRSLQADSRRAPGQPGVFRLLRGLLARTPPSPTSARTLDAEPALRAEPRPPSPEMRRSWSVEIPESRWPFVARAAERAELGQRMEEALAGRGSLVLVGGEPGIGKTRLAEEILREGRARGAVALLGHCSEMEGSPPYAPFVEMLEHSMRAVPEPRLRQALGDAAPEVAKLVPELRQLFPDIPPPVLLPPEQQRRFLFNAYREFVARACLLGPMVAVLEDLHWSDEPTLLLLEHLAEAFPSLPLLAIGTYRDVDLDAARPLARAVESLDRRHLATRMTLRRLGEQGVEELLSAMSGRKPPAAVVRALHHETEGNPYFVAEVFQHLSEEGRLFDTSGGFRLGLSRDAVAVPESVRLVIGRRLARLSETTQRLLTRAALVGRTFDLRLLEALEDAGAEAVLVSIEEAERAHLVAPWAEGREPRYGFTHELIRQTLAQTLSLPRKQRLHAQIAAAIERAHAGALHRQATVLAHHLYQAGPGADTEKTLSYLLAAAEQSSRSAAHEEALAHLERALTLCEGEESSRVAGLLARKGLACRGVGRIQEAIDTLRSAVRMSDGSGDLDGLASAAYALCETQAWFEPDRAMTIAEAAQTLERLDGVTSASRCRLQYVRALLCSAFGDLDGTKASLDEARRGHGSLEDAELDRVAANAETWVHWHLMQLPECWEAAERTGRLCRSTGDLWLQCNVECVQGLASLWLGRSVEAPRVDDTRRCAERIGHSPAAWILSLVSVWRALYAGDLEAADREAQGSVAYGNERRIPWVFHSHHARGVVAVYRDRLAEGLESMRRAVELETPSTYGGLSHAWLFWALAHAGDRDALRHLSEHRPPLPSPGRSSLFGAWASVAVVVEGLAWLGERDELARLDVYAEALVATGVTCYGSALFRSAAGTTAAACGDWGRAQAHYEVALEQAVSAPYRHAEPQVRSSYAEMLRERNATGDRDRARSLLEEAVASYAALGMTTFERRARERLAGL